MAKEREEKLNIYVFGFLVELISWHFLEAIFTIREFVKSNTNQKTDMMTFNNLHKSKFIETTYV